MAKNAKRFYSGRGVSSLLTVSTLTGRWPCFGKNAQISSEILSRKCFVYYLEIFSAIDETENTFAEQVIGRIIKFE